MRPFFNGVFLILVLICGANAAFSQAVPEATEKKFDSFFKQWDNKTTPGCAVAVIRNDSVIYAKGYSLAKAEYQVPITTKTNFEMGSVSTQFTAFTIMLLAKQGKLSFDDDIRKYLP